MTPTREQMEFAKKDKVAYIHRYLNGEIFEKKTNGKFLYVIVKDNGHFEVALHCRKTLDGVLKLLYKAKGKRKKSLVGYTSAGWSLYRGVSEINHWDIYRTQRDAPVAYVKVRITVEEI